MDLILNNEVSKNNIQKNETIDFAKELHNSLEKDSRISNLCNEILNEIPLASKYSTQLGDIIKECMDNLSYEYDFLYFDYDSKEKSYFLDYYTEGNITRINMSSEDLKDTHFENGSFWKIYDNENVAEADYFKDNIKINVEYELEMLENKNKKGK